MPLDNIAESRRYLVHTVHLLNDIEPNWCCEDGREREGGMKLPPESIKISLIHIQ